jgi:predicted secreted hydrolase
MSGTYPLPRSVLPWAAAALLILALAWAFRSCKPGLAQGDDTRRGRAETGLALPGLLGDTAGGFEKVTGPRPFRFPQDHGPHSAYRSEWWYFTGNLRDASGREFGYQLTFFRSALRADSGADKAPAEARESPWAANQAYMAHFALTDGGGDGNRAGDGRFHAFERFSRGALGLAGARAEPFRVWLEDWTCESLGGGSSPSTGDTAVFPLRLRAAQGGVAIDLVLEPGKPMVLQGDRGYSRKGPETGNASYYYSYTRMPTRGRVTTASGNLEVTGESWMDREWGSSILSPGLAGWEWFALRLEDSTEYLFFRLRDIGEAAAREDSVLFDYGIRVDSDGTSGRLAMDQVEARVLSRWTSPRGRTYPSRWRIAVPGDSLSLEIDPLIADQELDLSLPYWEGAIRVDARKEGKRLRGRGYMELTGY